MLGELFQGVAIADLGFMNPEIYLLLLRLTGGKGHCGGPEGLLLRSSSSISIEFEPVADTRSVHQKARPCRVRLQLMPELGHVDTKILRLVRVCGTPYLLQELTVGDDLAAVLDQHRQQPVFNGC